MAKQVLEEIAQYVDAPSVLRKILFATNNLPSDVPDYWKIVTNFATSGADQMKLTPSKISTRLIICITMIRMHSYLTRI